VLALMDSLGLARAHYCGLSLGGMVGMWLGVHAPERIDRLVLLCTAARLSAPEAYADRARAVRAAAATEPIVDAVLDRWLTPAFAARRPDVQSRLRATLVATSPEGYAGCCEAISEMDLRDEIGAISAPTLIISGAQDPATPVSQQAEIAAAIPGARHEIVEPAAHLAAVEQSARITELIGAHIT
jgi:3-oxoadipate enol-lactonase